MKYFIQKALADWAYRVNDGCPDPHNRTHIQVLENVLRQYGCTEQFISEYVTRVYNPQLTEADDDTKKDDGYSHIGNGVYVKAGQEDSDDATKYDKVGDGKYKEIEGDEESQEDSREYTKNMLTTPEPGSDADSEIPVKDDSTQSVIAGKNKTLKTGNPSETSEFMRDMEPDDTKFSERNKESAIPNPPPPYVIPESLLENPKFPKRYLKAIERMMNSTVTSKTKSWSHFSDIDGGAGQISAQAGELLTMIGSSLSDDEFQDLISGLEAHEKEQIANNPSLKKEGKRIITKSWMKSARNTRKAIVDRVKKQYGADVQIIGASWDAKEEVEALGLSDYEKNKGYSTDMYLKVRKSDGTELLDEISLKKDKNVNFLNSGTGTMVQNWDTDQQGTIIDPKIYSQREKVRLVNNAKKILPPDMLDSYEVQQALTVLRGEKPMPGWKLKRDGRKNSKIIRTALEGQAKKGNLAAQQYLEEDDKIHREMQNEAINQINTNPKMRSGLVNEIKEEFPLKAVSEGEETMAIGDMSLDKETMKDIFGTDDFESLKENLIVKKSDKGEPYLAFSIAGAEEVKVSNIVIRQDGRGYGGGSIKFEMKLHPELAKRLKEATVRVYS